MKFNKIVLVALVLILLLTSCEIGWDADEYSLDRQDFESGGGSEVWDSWLQIQHDKADREYQDGEADAKLWLELGN